jgi:hypothetical protein
MEKNKTDKELLLKGVKKMGLSLIFMFLGPVLIYVAFSNSEKSLYIPILLLLVKKKSFIPIGLLVEECTVQLKKN